MSFELSTTQIDKLLGAALRGMVQAGASDEAIGAFAASFRQDIVGIIGEPANAPSLEQLVTNALQTLRQDAAVRKQKERIKVWVGEKQTSLTIAPDLYKAWLKSYSSTRTANQAIEQLANAPEAQSSTNRSGWVSERMQVIMAAQAPHESLTAH